jgi:Tol biopolymer transport system component/predicted Ser/Thr protein kinase
VGLIPGSRIGSYEVLAKLGEGGMGEVYRARDTKLDRDVAIKVLPPVVAQDPERLARFEREAKSLAALNHPNIAQIYAVEQGAIVMELVPGAPLHGPLPIDTALEYAKQIASALEAAHEKGIVHRDLKPGNVMVTPDGVVKVLDFGLAGRADPDLVSRDLSLSPTLTVHATQAGVIIGTAAYMSPEQASGNAVNKRADIWAFGVIVWELLTGRQMFEGETISHVLAAVLTKEPDLGAVPSRVRPMLARCLEKDPKKRLRDIGDAISLAENRDIVAESRRMPWVGVSGWGVAAALAVALGVMAWMRPSSDAGSGPPRVRFQIDRTFANPLQTDFAVSPDGRRLAYYAEGEAGLALMVRDLTTGESTEISITAVFNPTTPFWSADGRHLAYWVGSGLYGVEIATGVKRLLCACRVRGGAWNRDGVIVLGSINAERQGIKRVSVADATPTTITNVDSSRGEFDAFPVFLPDGQRFVFTRFVGNASIATYVGSLDGSEPKQIDVRPQVIVGLAGTAGGPHLLGLDGTGLVARPVDLDGMMPTGEPVTVVAGATTASVSESGVLVTSGRTVRRGGVPAWFDRQGSLLGRVGQEGGMQTADLSPNAEKIAMTVQQDRDGQTVTDIWLRDAASGADSRVTFSPGSHAVPVWSPDGSRLVFSSRSTGVANLYQKSADGTGSEAPLFDSDHPTWANDWSRDGKWLIYSFSRTATDMDLGVLSLDAGAKPASYINGSGNQKQAQISPDGRFVAYASDETGDWEIYVQPSPGVAEGKWMISNGGGLEPRWSRDRSELFYLAGQKLMAVPVRTRPTFSTGAAAPLFDAPMPAGNTSDGRRWQVSPDGERFLFVVPAGENRVSPIEVVVNWQSLIAK